MSAGGVTPARVSVMKHFLIATLLALAALAPGPGAQTFTGTITDDVCGSAGHARMRMGPTDAECTLACISAHGAAFVLYDGKNVYMLSDQRTPEQFAGQKVRITGRLDPKTKTIQVEAVRAAK